MAIIFWNIPLYFFVYWRRSATEKKTLRMVQEAADEKEKAMKTEIEMSDVKPTEGGSNDNMTERETETVVVATHEKSETQAE